MVKPATFCVIELLGSRSLQAGRLPFRFQIAKKDSIPELPTNLFVDPAGGRERLISRFLPSLPSLLLLLSVNFDFRDGRRAKKGERKLLGARSRSSVLLHCLDLWPLFSPPPLRVLSYGIWQRATTKFVGHALDQQHGQFSSQTQSPTNPTG